MVVPFPFVEEDSGGLLEGNSLVFMIIAIVFIAAALLIFVYKRKRGKS